MNRMIETEVNGDDFSESSEALPNVQIIAVGPTGFPGASQIMCRWLLALSKAGIVTDLVVSRVPFALKGVQADNFRCHIQSPIRTAAVGPHGAVGSTDTLLIPALAERIADLARDTFVSTRRLIIWGTYLVPYGASAAIARDLIEDQGRHCELWLTPTGSDIWEIGPQLHAFTRRLLDRSATRVITYSDAFRREIASALSVERHIDVVMPIVPAEFRRLDDEDRARRRVSLGIDDSAFVMTHHSNMRPVKRPDDILDVAIRVARNLRPRAVHLFLIGPKVQDLTERDTGHLVVHWVGVRKSVRRYLAASDVELNLSVHDSFNVSLAEAMACGVPVISTSIVGIAGDILKSGGGFVFPVADSGGNQCDRYSDVVASVTALARSREMQRALGARAATYADLHFRDIARLTRLVLRGVD